MIRVLFVVRQQPRDQSIALVGRGVGHERAKIAGRRQQAPDVQVSAPGERRIRHQRRLRHARLREIRGDEAIGRTAPCGPDDRRQRRSLERERRLPGCRRRRGGGRCSRALIDPPLQERDLLVAQRQLVERHAIADGALDLVDHQAARRAARPHHGAILAAVEHVAVGRERETALALVLAMTLETVLGKERLNVSLEIDERRRPGRGRHCRPRRLRRGWRTRRRRRRARGALRLERGARSSEYRDGQNGRGAADGARDRAGAGQLTHGEGSLKRLVYSPLVVFAK